MNSRRSPARLLPILPAVLFSACAPSAQNESPPPPAPAGWQVREGFLRAPDGRVVLLRGANVAGEHKMTPYLDTSRAEDYARLRSVWGMNAIRFIMTWAAIQPAPDRYDEAYLDAVATRLRWAHEAGLAVVLDMHQDIYGEGFGFDGAPRWACDEARYRAFVPREPWFLNSLDPNVQACVDAFFTQEETLRRFTAAWVRVAQRFAAEPAVVGFDVLNEPSWGSYAVSRFDADRLQPLYERIVAAVRSQAPSWVAFLEPGASRNVGFATRLQPFSFANVMYSPHSYDSAAESGSGFDPARRDFIKDTVAELRQEATALGAGLWIGEYGGMPEHPGYAEYMRAQYDAASAVSAGSMYWAYSRGGGYSMLDAEGRERPTVLSALVRPYPERIAGTPLGSSYDPDTRTFLFRYQPAKDLRLPTEMFIPERVFGADYRVDCTGCTYEIDGATLRVTAREGVPEVSVRVTGS